MQSDDLYNRGNDPDKVKECMFSRIDSFMDNEFSSNNNFNLKKIVSNINESQKLVKIGSNKACLSKLLKDEMMSKKQKIVCRNYDELSKIIQTRIKNKQYYDLVTREKAKHRNKVKELEKEKNRTMAGLSISTDSDEEDEELIRLDFTESILFSNTKQIPGPAYWYIMKLMHYMRVCNTKGSLICILSLQEFLPKSNEVVKAFEDSRSITLLLNMLSADELPIRIASMIILLNLTSAAYFIRVITFFDAMPILIENLRENEPELQRYTCLILANLCLFCKARQKLREHWGLHMLLCLLDELASQLQLSTELDKTKTKQTTLSNKLESVSAPSAHMISKSRRETPKESINNLLVAITTVLWRASRSRRNRLTLLNSGLICIVKSLIHIADEVVCIPLTGLLHNCSIDTSFRIAIATEEILPVLLKQLSSNSICIKSYSALTLYRCSHEAMARKIFAKSNAIELLHNHLDSEVNKTGGTMELIQARHPDMMNEIRIEETVRFKCNKAVNELVSNEPKKRTRFAIPCSTDEQPVSTNMSKESKQNVSKTIHSNTTQQNTSTLTNRKSLQDFVSSGSSGHFEDKVKYLNSLTGVIAKLAEDRENAQLINKQGTTNLLLRILAQLTEPICNFVRPICSASEKLNELEWSEKIVRNTIKALGSLAEIDECCQTIVDHPSGVLSVIMLLRQGPHCLLDAVCSSICRLMNKPLGLKQFCNLDGLRLLTLHACKGTHKIRIQAIHALYSCLQHNQETGRLLKPFVGFIHDLINICQAHSDELDTVQACCSVIAEVAKNLRCLAVLTNLGVLKLLEDLIPIAETDGMKKAVASAICSCSQYSTNNEVLGSPNNIHYLMSYLKTEDKETLTETIRAFCVLSKNPKIARHIYEAGISQILLKMVGHADVELQAAAAVVIRNINKLNKLDNEYIKTLKLQQVFESNWNGREDTNFQTSPSIRAN